MSREAVIAVYNKWCTIPDKIRFLLVGGWNAAFSYVIFSIALYIIGQQNYQICVLTTFSVFSLS